MVGFQFTTIQDYTKVALISLLNLTTIELSKKW